MSALKHCPNWDYVCVAGIDDWDRVALKVLAEHDGVGPAELASHVKQEQFDTRMASAWFKDADSRGLVRKGEGTPTRYVLTAKGRADLTRSSSGPGRSRTGAGARQ